MAKALGIFTSTQPEESEVFAFDFTTDLPEGDTITAVTATTLARAYGAADADPQSHIKQTNHTDTLVSIRISGCVGGTTYALSAIVTTAQGNTLELWSYLACAKVAS